MDIKKGDTLLGLYRVESDPIYGGMGVVYHVHSIDENIGLAMKQGLVRYGAEKNKEMFDRECKMWTSLGIHPNIVRLHNVCEIDGIPSIFFEWIDGGSVSDLMKKNGGKLSIATASHILLQILDGLDYIHHVNLTVLLNDGSTCSATGVVHRDVKPSNFLLSDTSNHPVAKLTGFDLAKKFSKQRK